MKFSHLLVALVSICLSPTQAISEARVPDAIILALPTEIPEISTSGNWTNKRKRGTYRAVVIVSGDRKNYTAKVYMQWIEVPEKDGAPRVAITKPITEFNTRNLPTAFIELVSEKDNEMKLLISSFNPKTDEDLEIEVTADGEGNYKAVVSGSADLSKN